MRGFNKVVLMGNLTRDPELRAIPSGQNVCSFSLAVNRTWKNASGEQQEAVDYIDCNIWGKPAEIINQYMKKGSGILVSGRLQQRSWEQEGQKRSKVEVVVEDFNFVAVCCNTLITANFHSFSFSNSFNIRLCNQKSDNFASDI